MNEELNTRQFRLYDLIKERSEKGEWTYEFDLYNELKEHYPIFNGSRKEFHDSGVRLMMTNDIRAINCSTTIQKIILTCSRGVKLVSVEEYSVKSEKILVAALKRLKLVNLMIRKMKRNDQMRLKLDGIQREYYESFVKVCSEKSGD